MTIDLHYVANHITDEEFAKVIISSGDHFPGFYRFTMGHRNYERRQLSCKGLLSCYFDQEVNNKKYTREQWTSYTKERHKSLDSRNASRSDSSIYELLDRGYYNWMIDANEYDIALIEIDCGVNTLQENQTYFFMGSLIRFQENEFILGYDLLRNESVMKINVDINNLIDYTHELYKNHLKDFFLPADCVASLKFDNSGTVHMTNETITRTMSSSSNSIVIASNRDVSKNIPIRWAKDILLTEVSEL